MTNLKLNRLIDRPCPTCGTIYKADPERLKWGRNLYCSRPCALVKMSAAQTKRVTVTCKVCGKEYQTTPYKAKTRNAVCCWACYVKGKSEGLFPKGKPEVKPTFTFTCERCNKSVTLASSRKGARRFRFCSPECANASNAGSNNVSWRGGYKGYYGSNWKSQRRAARKRDKYTCQDCGLTEKQHGKQMHVHHIIPFNHFLIAEAANYLKNLVTLCPWCHMKREWATRKTT